MSYCRFSSGNFSSDVYCYADCEGGWTTWVAGNRPVGDVPQVPEFGSVPDDDWLAAHNAQIEFLKVAECKDIDLPRAGECIHTDTEQETIAALLELRGLGYNVPQYALDRLVEEAKETTENE